MSTIRHEADELTAEELRAIFGKVRRETRLTAMNGTAPEPGTSIGIMAASKKYGIPHGTIWRWVDRGMIPVLRQGTGSGPGTATEIDEREMARIAESYRENPGKGKRTAVASA